MHTAIVRLVYTTPGAVVMSMFFVTNSGEVFAKLRARVVEDCPVMGWPWVAPGNSLYKVLPPDLRTFHELQRSHTMRLSRSMDKSLLFCFLMIPSPFQMRLASTFGRSCRHTRCLQVETDMHSHVIVLTCMRMEMVDFRLSWAMGSASVLSPKGFTASDDASV